MPTASSLAPGIFTTSFRPSFQPPKCRRRKGSTWRLPAGRDPVLPRETGWGLRRLRAVAEDAFRQPPTLPELVEGRVQVGLSHRGSSAPLHRGQSRLAKKLLDVGGARAGGPIDERVD